MIYKTSYCSHEALEGKLNDHSKDGWHVMQLLPHDGKTITIVFYKDNYPSFQLTKEMGQKIDDAIEGKVELETPTVAVKKSWWKR